MSKSNDIALLGLSLTKGVGPVTIKNLISLCGSAEAVFATPVGKLKKAPGVGEKVAHLIKHSEGIKQAEQELSWCESQGVDLVSYLDPGYPHLLKYIHHAPLFLFRKGAIELNAQPNIAIVGTRKASSYGKALTEQFATFFAERNINVVSGLAYGIDIIAHKAVLKAGGKTTCVLGHGLDFIYPGTHSAKAQEMLERGGWLSEYLTGTQPDAPHFPARNRIVAGMCRAVVVIEAAESGGALITARQAFDSNREVFAIPGRIGDPVSAGCNKLISEQVARLVSSPEEVLEELDIQWNNTENQAPKEPPIPLNKEEALVLNVLQQGEALVDQLHLKTGLQSSRLNSLLLAMEFKDLIEQMPGKKFRMK
ncbi:MAG: DNA-processing protein DprA [Bacteroidia bacterium]|nr:DNA-processing protein DprA [Bacteroidia bacterium]